MATRGNYVFASLPRKKVEDEKGERWEIDVEAIVKLKLGISNDNEIVKRGHKIYVHWDNYPSGALPRLFQFLGLDGAKARATDSSYLSAWFITYNCLLNSEWEIDNCDIKGKTDFTGIGLENELSDWCDYTYLILPDVSGVELFPKFNGFRIFIFDYEFNFIDEVHTADGLEIVKNESWWH